MSLVIDKLHVSLGKNKILRGVDLVIPPGSFFSLLGPSGCGKSTLLKTIAGLLPQKSGHILWSGESLDGLPPEKRGMVMVFQDLRLFPHMTLLDNVAFPLKMTGAKKDARHNAARQMLELVQLEGLETRRPHQLSGGQQQRAVLARALVASPKALLLDEPFSSLDAPLRADMRDLVCRLHKQLGTTMLLVTHDQEEALAMSDAMAVMASGHILQTGAPRDVYTRPHSLAVAQHFYRGNQVEGNVTGGQFLGSGLSFPATHAGWDGPAVALLPPDSLSLKSGPGAFAVSALQYAGSHLKATIANGQISLYMNLALKQANLLRSQICLAVDADRVFVFPRGDDKGRRDDG